MTERTIRTALISTDRGFREMVKDVFLSHEGWAAPALEITAPFRVASVRSRSARCGSSTPSWSSSTSMTPPSWASSSPSSCPRPRPASGSSPPGPLLQPEHLLTAMRAGVADYLPKPVDRRGASRRARPRPSAGGHRTARTSARRSRSDLRRSTAPRAAQAPPPRPPISPWCSTGSPARRRCWWTWTSSWGRSRSCSACSRGSTSWTWCRTSTGWMPSCWRPTSSGTSPASTCCPHRISRKRPRS